MSKLKFKTRKFNLDLILLLIFLALPFYNIFSVDFVDGHDFLLHFHMIFRLEKSIKEGIILPRLIPEAAYGYGSPVFTFMWAVPYYLGAFIHMAGLTYQQVFKILILVPNILSGLGFFLWSERKYGRFIAVVSATVYIFAPYRFLDSLIRNALGELFFFAFFPFVLFFLDRAKSKKDIIIGSFFTALMIYSHQGLSLIGYPIFICYILLQHIPEVLSFIKKPYNHNHLGGGKLIRLRRRSYDSPEVKLTDQLLILTGGLLLTFFYWFPVITYHHLLPIREGKIKSIWFPPLWSLIRSKWEGGSVFDGKRLIMSFQIGLGQLGIIFSSHFYLLYYLIKQFVIPSQPRLWRGKSRNLTPPKVWTLRDPSMRPSGLVGMTKCIFWLSLFWLSVFFMQPVSKWFWVNIPLIINLQFPFRLLFIPMFTAAILSGLILFQTKKPLRFILGFLFVSAVIITNRNHLRVLNKEVDLKAFFAYQGTYDVGGEKLPKYVNLQEIKKDFEKNGKGEEFTITSGKGKIISQKREDYISTAEIDMESDGKVHLRRIYFPGWQVYLNGKKTDNFDKGNGIFIKLPEGKSEIKAQYKDPFLVTFSNFVSFISFLIFFIILLFLIPANSLL